METRTAIESHNLSFSYGTLPVLENVSFSVPKGSYTALIGANGAGKSTLLKLLLGELTPTSGSLSLLGQPIRSFRDWPRIGYVPQGTQAGYADFPASVSEVVSAPSATCRAVRDSACCSRVRSPDSRRCSFLTSR